VAGGESKTGGRGWGLGGEGLSATGAFQHHSLNLSCGSRKPANLEKESFFCMNDAGMSMKTKDRCGKVPAKRECL
jgi:hypothetical protein